MCNDNDLGRELKSLDKEDEPLRNNLQPRKVTMRTRSHEKQKKRDGFSEEVKWHSKACRNKCIWGPCSADLSMITGTHFTCKLHKTSFAFCTDR